MPGVPTPEPTAEETAPSPAPRGTTPRGASARPGSGQPASEQPAARPAARPALRDRVGSLLDEHLRPTAKFLLVGGIVFLLDAAMYNLLVFWDPGEGWGRGVMHSSPLIAKVMTIAAASCLTYLGNRLWTFGDRPSPDTTRSIALFVLVNLIASGLQLSCLGFSRYVLGLDSVLADNISGTFIGQAVSTSFRYVTYGRFVFPKR